MGAEVLDQPHLLFNQVIDGPLLTSGQRVNIWQRIYQFLVSSPSCQTGCWDSVQRQHGSHSPSVWLNTGVCGQRHADLSKPQASTQVQQEHQASQVPGFTPKVRAAGSFQTGALCARGLQAAGAWLRYWQCTTGVCRTPESTQGSRDNRRGYLQYIQCLWVLYLKSLSEHLSVANAWVSFQLQLLTQ